MQKKEWKNTTLEKGFLFDKQSLNRKVTMQAVWNRFDETGRIGAFRFDWKEGEPNRPHIFWDSDVAKWMEAAAYILAKEEDSDLREKVEWLIDRIEENQDANGYFNIFYTVCEPDNRFTHSGCHELYCCGHLLEAACAYYDACGDVRFLNLMQKYIDHIYQVFVVEKSAAFLTPGHEEIELALMRLYRITGNQKHLDLCMHFLNTRGTEEDRQINEKVYGPTLAVYRVAQAGTGADRSDGHTVRALYLYSAMADAALETKDEALHAACNSLFADIVNKKMHITGGLGQSRRGETFSIPYDLKNDVAYAETCASIAMILFCERMFAMERDSKYHDLIERELFNGMMSGLSLKGDEFFYTNPLEINLQDHDRDNTGYEEPPEWLPITQRVKVFNCSCCPPNVNRTLASIERLVYTRENKDVYINQFAQSRYEDGEICVQVQTDYPSTGVIHITATGAERIYVRIPAWCKNFTVSGAYEMVNGYAKVAAGDITVELKIEPVVLMANENVWDDANKVAVMRGPVVYCVEQLDNTAEPHKLYVDVHAPICVEPGACFGLPMLSVGGFVRKTSQALYSELEDCFDKTEIRLIPYYGFANRGETNMRVWLNYR